VVYAVIIGNILSGTTFIFVSIFQCIPVQAAWKRWDRTVQARCVSANSVGWANGAINIILDIVILVLPLPELTKLSMSKERKIHVILVFSLGSLQVHTRLPTTWS
jgi:hypothetical protein